MQVWQIHMWICRPLFWENGSSGEYNINILPFPTSVTLPNFIPDKEEVVCFYLLFTFDCHKVTTTPPSLMLSQIRKQWFSYFRFCIQNIAAGITWTIQEYHIVLCHVKIFPVAIRFYGSILNCLAFLILVWLYVTRNW